MEIPKNIQFMRMQYICKMISTCFLIWNKCVFEVMWSINNTKLFDEWLNISLSTWCNNQEPQVCVTWKHSKLQIQKYSIYLKRIWSKNFCYEMIWMLLFCNDISCSKTNFGGKGNFGRYKYCVRILCMHAIFTLVFSKTFFTFSRVYH